jgi:RNA polymerase sigma-70 factor (ECF subfamily)
VKTGAVNVVEHLWNALSIELRACVRSRLPSESDADDILQDVFVRVVEKIGSLTQADRVESWVYQIARNAIADFYRRRTSRLPEVVDDVIDPQERSGDNNRNHAIGSWLSIMVESLPEKLRHAVRLYEVEGLSQAEIAKRLGISLSGAKSRVQRGRRQLEQLLLNSCQLELDRRGNIIECKPASDHECGQVSCECTD